MTSAEQRVVRGASRARRIAGGAALIALSLVAILIWGKLKLVAGVPRTALADPDRVGAPVNAATADGD